MKTYTYQLLDVFTSVPFGGNPLAVFTDARGLSDSQMQSIARELNLSETTFVLPARDRSHHSWVRIFTPLAEVTSGGHPTIGTAHALALEERLRRETARQRVVFEEGVGPVSVLMEAPMITVRLPLPEFGPIFEQRDAVAAMLGLETILLAGGPIQAISCGVTYLLVPIVDLESMINIRFRIDIWDRMLRHSAHPQVLPFCIETRYPESSVHARMFAPGLGVYEDPASASAAGPLAAYLVKYGVIKPDPRAQLIVEQGIEVQRPSFIHVSLEMDGERFSSIRVGGQCVVIGKGQIHVNVAE
jgi:trans-2,3-dihydro-3-hydroxyanthranilate isomerase